MESLKAAGYVFLATLVTALVIVCLVSLPLQIAMIIIGAKYKDECSVEPLIPIYLIVAGAFGLVANCCSCGIRYQEGGQSEERSVNPMQLVVQLFIFAWFVCGNVWIYTNYQPNYDDTESAEYCNKTLYLFAFWATTSYHIITGLVLTCLCVAGVCAATKTCLQYMSIYP